MRFHRGEDRLLAGLSCQTGGCEICGDWQKACWGRRIRHHLRLLGEDATAYVGYVTPGREWATFRQCMCRARGCYASVLVEATRQRFVVATTPFAGAEAVTVAEAMRRVSEAIRALTTSCSEEGGEERTHPVTCCRRWPGPDTPDEEAPPAPGERWVCEGRISDDTDLDRVPRVLHSFDICCRELVAAGRRFLRFSVPPGWTNNDERQLWTCIELGVTRAEDEVLDRWLHSAAAALRAQGGGGGSEDDSG
jgi:hypothetical protein